jgi:hypothetical protein
LASALRIEASSSTTKTMGVDFGSSFIDRRGWGTKRNPIAAQPSGGTLSGGERQKNNERREDFAKSE